MCMDALHPYTCTVLESFKRNKTFRHDTVLTDTLCNSCLNMCIKSTHYPKSGNAPGFQYLKVVSFSVTASLCAVVEWTMTPVWWSGTNLFLSLVNTVNRWRLQREIFTVQGQKEDSWNANILKNSPRLHSDILVILSSVYGKVWLQKCFNSNHLCVVLLSKQVFEVQWKTSVYAPIKSKSIPALNVIAFTLKVIFL